MGEFWIVLRGQHTGFTDGPLWGVSKTGKSDLRFVTCAPEKELPFTEACSRGLQPMAHGRNPACLLFCTGARKAFACFKVCENKQTKPKKNIQQKPNLTPSKPEIRPVSLQGSVAPGPQETHVLGLRVPLTQAGAGAGWAAADTGLKLGGEDGGLLQTVCKAVRPPPRVWAWKGKSGDQAPRPCSLESIAGGGGGAPGKEGRRRERVQVGGLCLLPFHPHSHSARGAIITPTLLRRRRRLRGHRAEVDPPGKAPATPALPIPRSFSVEQLH